MDRLADRLSRLAFVLALVVLAVLYGVFAVRNDWFPAPQIALTEATLADLGSHWQNDLGLEPTRHLVPARAGAALGEGGFRLHRVGAAEPGFVAVAGLSPEQERSFHAITLYDDTGRQVHRWPVRYDRIAPEGEAPENVMIHGVAFFEDGSIVLAFDNGAALARLDPCGEPMWVTEGGFHHVVHRADDDRLWSWRGDEIVSIDAETGEVLSSLSLRQTIMHAGDGQLGILGMHALTREEKPLEWAGDPFHTNDVEPLEPAMAAAFPMFEPGDLLVSLREVNLVAVVEPETGRFKWYRHGPWHRQHDPDFQPDGTISVFDNATGLDHSRILSVDPASGAVETPFEGSEAVPFYTWRRGKHQRLPGGNWLLTESERGRVLEVDANGALVWEREFPWDDGRNLIVTQAEHLPPGFFTDDAPSCPPDGTLASAE
ncbi:MAG: arylsulfotransferase family protein [Paracoccaceae bacterium]